MPLYEIIELGNVFGPFVCFLNVLGQITKLGVLFLFVSPKKNHFGNIYLRILEAWGPRLETIARGDRRHKPWGSVVL